jgi:hypothetical protein
LSSATSAVRSVPGAAALAGPMSEAHSGRLASSFWSASPV